jgi:F0F1-type ATP synthase assembly protein I
MSNAALDVLIWVLVYGGLLLVCVGIFLRRSADSLGWFFIVAGGVIALAGAGLVVLRSTRAEEDTGKE